MKKSVTHILKVKNLEISEKRARKLVAINSHAELSSSAAYLCLQQESMSVTALSRLLEAVTKSIQHSMQCPLFLPQSYFRLDMTQQ